MKKGKGSKTIRIQHSTRVKTGDGGALQYSRYSRCPRITMEGNWLEELGFRAGEKVNVEYGPGCLSIRLADSGADRRHSEGGEGVYGGPGNGVS